MSSVSVISRFGMCYFFMHVEIFVTNVRRPYECMINRRPGVNIRDLTGLDSNLDIQLAKALEAGFSLRRTKQESCCVVTSRFIDPELLFQIHNPDLYHRELSSCAECFGS